MHEKRYSSEIERLRSPERIAMIEVERVVDVALSVNHVNTVLDVGTGTGVFAEAFAKKGKTVTGIDPNPEMLKAANEIIPNGSFLQGIIEDTPYQDESFDLVFLGLVLHESDDIIQALKESKRCARQRVVILEWPYKKEEYGPPLEHRIKSEDLMAAIREVGFSKIETTQLKNLNLYVLTV